MTIAQSTLLALGATAQLVSATWYLDAPIFNLPGYSDTQCTDQQSTGFDWSDLSIGSFSSYGGCDFSGFECTNSFLKRDRLDKRTFGDLGSKCISGSIPYGDGSYTSGPSMSYGDGFSIKDFQVQTDRTTDVTFYYGMEDGSTCTSTHNCGESGTYISNDQCGGAKTVQWEIPSYESDSSDCNIGIYQVGFYCGAQASQYSSVAYTPSSTANPYNTPPPTYDTPIYTPPATSAYETSPAYVAPTSSDYVYTPADTTTTSSYGYEQYTSVYVPPYQEYTSTYDSPDTTSAYQYTPTYESPATTETTSSQYYQDTTTSQYYEDTTTSAYYQDTTTSAYYQDTTTPQYYQDTTTSQYYQDTTTSEYYQDTTTSAYYADTTSSEYNQYTSTYESPITTSTTSSQYYQPTPSSYSPPPADAPCPDVLPKCLNTWIFKTGCKDNTDYSCYCSQPEFTKKVIQCVDSWSNVKVDISDALSYMAGICAPYIPKNPGIITNVPSTISICPTPSKSHTAKGGSPTGNGKYPGKVYEVPYVKPTITNGGTVFQTTTSTVTVPQVYFANPTKKSGDSQLVVGSPKPVYANPTYSTFTSYYPTARPSNGTVPVPPAPTNTGNAASKAGVASGSVVALLLGAAAYLL